MAHPGRPLKSAPEVDNLRSDIANGDFDTAKQTLKTFGIDAADGDGRTALINAVIEKKLDFIKWLLDNGASPTIKTGLAILLFILRDRKSLWMWRSFSYKEEQIQTFRTFTVTLLYGQLFSMPNCQQMSKES